VDVPSTDRSPALLASSEPREIIGIDPSEYLQIIRAAVAGDENRSANSTFPVLVAKSELRLFGIPWARRGRNETLCPRLPAMGRQQIRKNPSSRLGVVPMVLPRRFRAIDDIADGEAHSASE
jgi:hypothetical protein